MMEECRADPGTVKKPSAEKKKRFPGIRDVPPPPVDPHSDFKLPTQEDINRDIQIIRDMLKESRTDPSFKKALDLKCIKFNIYQELRAKDEEMQRFKTDPEFYRLIKEAELLQGNIDVNTVSKAKEIGDKLIDFLEMNRKQKMSFYELKGKMKETCEEEKQYEPIYAEFQNRGL